MTLKLTHVLEELLNLHRGQGLDLFWRDSLTCPTEEEYIHMVLGSTSGSHLVSTVQYTGNILRQL